MPRKRLYSLELRSNMKTWWILGLAVLVGCTAPEPEQATRQPKRLEQGSPVALAGRIVAMDAATIAGDQKAAKAHSDAAQAEIRKSLKMADPGRKINQELARSAAKNVEGVRSVVWLDHENLFVIVKENAQRSSEMIDQICMELEPLGDTLAVVVNLQSGAATNGDELEILSRNCQLESGERAFLQRNRQVDVLSPSVRAQHKANNADRQ